MVNRGFGYTPVVRSQQAIADTLKGGLSGLAQVPLDKAKFGLVEAQTLHNLARQKKLDAYHEPGLELQQQKDQHELDERARPMHISEPLRRFYGKETDTNTIGGPSRQGITHTLSEGYLFDALKMGGIELREDGFMYRPDGTQVTGADRERVDGIMTAVARSKFDAGHALDQKVRELDKIGKANWTDQQKAWYADAKKKQGSKQWKIDKHYEQIEKRNKMRQVLGTWGVKDFSGFDKDEARDNRKIEGLQEALIKEGDREFEMEKLGKEEAGKDRRHKDKMVLEIEKLFSAEQIAKSKAKKGGDGRKYSDRLAQQKHEAYTAYLSNSASPEQIRVFGLDKDVYLAQASKLVNDEQAVLFEDERLSPEMATEKIINLANRMRKAALPKSEGNDPLEIR